MLLLSFFRIFFRASFACTNAGILLFLLSACSAPETHPQYVIDAAQQTRYYRLSESESQRYLVHNLPQITLPAATPPPQLASLPPETSPVPPDIAPTLPLMADLVQVEKSQRKLTLIHDGAVLREYQMVLGFNPNGHKQQEGDGRTPEGIYEITYKNPQSNFHRSLRISYPNAYDKAIAAAKGVSPGGDIVIHGLPNDDPNASRTQHPNRDWTWGCIAVNNTQIEEIWDLVPSGTPIHILP